MNRRITVALGAALVAGSVLLPASAQAVAYRYWTYWTAADGGSWTYSGTGPAGVVPADGAVEGWRFAVTEGMRGQGQSPRIAAAAAFRQFCGDERVSGGEKRVAVVFDFGDPADAPPDQTPPAPRGTCVVTSAAATGAMVLSQAATVRTDRGLVCAIADYPQGECAPAIAAEPSHSADPSPTQRSQRATGRGAPDVDEPDPTPVESGPAPSESRPTSGAADPTPDAERDGNARNDGTDGSQTAGSRQERPTGTPAAAPTVTSTQEPAVAASPVFTEAQAVTQTPPRPWWPVALTVALLAGIGGVIWWRRRAPR